MVSLLDANVQQVTDAHLLGLAHHHGVRLATFDKAILRLVPAGMKASHLVDLIPQ